MNTKNDRSANASIKGYNYQFLHSIKDILESEPDAIHTVEGIEDLDIDTDDSRTLIQYKYHETQTYSRSLVAEPIAIMFNRFINNPYDGISYKLFIYVKNKIKTLPNLDSSELFKILGNKNAKISDNDKLLINQTNLENFISKFEWRLTKPYDKLEIDLIDILESIMGVANDESRMLYLPNAVKIIINLAIKKDQLERQITKNSFIEHLKNCKNTYHASYILRVKGFKALKSEIDSYKETYNILKFKSDYIVQINDIKRDSLSMLIIELAKKFCYVDNDSTYRPITFIIDCETTQQYNKFKTDIHEYIVSQNDLIKINDGYDSYAFNEKVFNEDCFYGANKSRKKYMKVNFNFKLIHKPIYEKNQDKIVFTNPSLFIIDSIAEPIVNNNIKKQFYLNKKLDNQQIINIIES